MSMKSQREIDRTKDRVKCLRCNEILQSKHVHDFYYCGCGSVAVDGGDQYLRIIGEQKDWKILEANYN